MKEGKEEGTQILSEESWSVGQSVICVILRNSVVFTCANLSVWSKYSWKSWDGWRES